VASVKRADFVLKAGEGLAVDAVGAVKSGVEAGGSALVSGNFRAAFGLRCALGELDAVGTAINGSIGSLSASLDGALEISSAL
jgi:hypothetical protein